MSATILLRKNTQLLNEPYSGFTFVPNNTSHPTQGIFYSFYQYTDGSGKIAFNFDAGDIVRLYINYILYAAYTVQARITPTTNLQEIYNMRNLFNNSQNICYFAPYGSGYPTAVESFPSLPISIQNSIKFEVENIISGNITVSISERASTAS